MKSKFMGWFVDFCLLEGVKMKIKHPGIALVNYIWAFSCQISFFLCLH